MKACLHFALLIGSLSLVCYRPLLARAGATSATTGGVTIENDSFRLVLSDGGGIKSFALRNGRELLGQADARLMLLQIGGNWHNSSALVAKRDGLVAKRDGLVANRDGDAYRLMVGFQNTRVTANVILKIHSQYVEFQTVGLEGEGRDAVEKWIFANVPANIQSHAGDWLNVAWDATDSAALIGLDERTRTAGSPVLQAAAIRKLGLEGRRAALIACPRAGFLDLLQQIEKEHGLPCPTLGGHWAKTSSEVRKSWMITGLTATAEPAAWQAERVFQTAQSLGVRHVVIALYVWNTSFGRYTLNRKLFPDGVASLKAVADKAHARGLKLGIHVMTRSITKDDPLVTPRPDPRLLTDGEVTLASAVDAAAKAIPCVESPAAFGTASGYWAFRGTDLLLGDEIISYRAIKDQAPFALTECVRGAYGTKAAPHAAGTKVRHLTEQYGWYVANPELAEEIGRGLARLIDDAGLDMVCFDGADVTPDPETRHFDAHKVPLGIYRNVHRDVLLASNGTSHYGWHLMARGGEDDAESRGYQGFVDHHTVHRWGAYHIDNMMPPDFSWVGIFPHTPTLTAARPDDVELVCARSLGYDAPIGWAFAACAGGDSTVDSFQRNGRREELARVIRSYETVRLENRFSREACRPLQEMGTSWRLLPANVAGHPYSLQRARYLQSGIIRPAAPESALWQVRNDLGPQPLRVRIEALSALAPYGAAENLAVADFGQLSFSPTGHPAANPSVEKTGEIHPQAGTVVRLRSVGLDPKRTPPATFVGHGENVWAQFSAKYPAKLDLRRHRALGLWIHGDGGGEVLGVRLEVTPQCYLHFYQPIDFSGWKYCELGEPESDRIMDYFTCDKFALADVPLDTFTSVTLMILNPPPSKNVELLLGRIEALREIGGRLVNPRLTIGGATVDLPATLEPEQYLETGDLWATRDPAVCRSFDPDGVELRRTVLKAVPPTVPAGASEVRFTAAAPAMARAKVTVMLMGNN